MPISLAEVRNENFVGFDVLAEFGKGLEQFLGALGMLRDRLQIKFQPVDDLKRPIHVAML